MPRVTGQEVPNLLIWMLIELFATVERLVGNPFSASFEIFSHSITRLTLQSGGASEESPSELSISMQVRAGLDLDGVF